jgi:hypothetical protein
MVKNINSDNDQSKPYRPRNFRCSNLCVSTVGVTTKPEVTPEMVKTQRAKPAPKAVDMHE